ncbi:MAG: hypothetical protein WDZ60_00560, partial [Wenzhouxiangellaceae bacterium]
GEILNFGDYRILYQAIGSWGINPGRNKLLASRENDPIEEMGTTIRAGHAGKGVCRAGQTWHLGWNPPMKLPDLSPKS